MNLVSSGVGLWPAEIPTRSLEDSPYLIRAATSLSRC
jgi:hypothetical protein